MDQHWRSLMPKPLEKIPSPPHQLPSVPVPWSISLLSSNPSTSCPIFTLTFIPTLLREQKLFEENFYHASTTRSSLAACDSIFSTFSSTADEFSVVPSKAKSYFIWIQSLSPIHSCSRTFFQGFSPLACTIHFAYPLNVDDSPQYTNMTLFLLS